MSTLAPNPRNDLDQKPICRMARLAEWIVRANAIVEDMPDDEAEEAFTETMAPLWSEFFDRPPETLTTEGATAALRALLLSEEIQAGPDRVVRSILWHLESLSPGVPVDICSSPD